VCVCVSRGDKALGLPSQPSREWEWLGSLDELLRAVSGPAPQEILDGKD